MKNDENGNQILQLKILIKAIERIENEYQIEPILSQYAYYILENLMHY